MYTEDIYDLDAFAASVHECVEKFGEVSDSKIKITFKIPKSVDSILKNVDDDEALSESVHKIVIEADSVNHKDIAAVNSLNSKFMQESSKFITCYVLGDYWSEFKKTAKRLKTSLRILIIAALLKRNNLLRISQFN